VEDRPRLTEALEQVLATGTPKVLEHRIVRPDGIERTVEIRAQVLRTDTAGNIARLVGVVQDVSERKYEEIARQLKLPLGTDMKYVQKMVKLSSRPIALIDDGTSDSALRRLLFDAGEDLEDLFTLCKADITTKNASKQEKFKKNFEYVAKKIKEVEEKDHVRNFQPPISGEEIMEMFQLKPGREIGILKEKVKEAILEGEIANDKDEARNFVIKEAKLLGLEL